MEAQQTPAREESPQLQRARAKLAQLELLLKQGKTILQDLRVQGDAVKKERDELRGQLDALHVKLQSVIAERNAALAEKDAAVADRDAAVAAKDAAVADSEAAVTHLEAAVAEIKEMTGKRDEMAVLLSELRADRDRLADELRSTESRRAALEEQVGVAAGDVEQLRADAERARTLAREIVEIYKPA